MRRALLGLLVFACEVSVIGQDREAAYRDRVDTLTDTLPGRVGGVTVDQTGFIYVADFGEKVWKITPQGDVKVFVESMYGASGNSVDSRGNLIQSNFYGNFLARVSRAGEVSVIADKGLAGPVGVAADPQDNFYVCNCQGNTIAKVESGGEVTEFAKSDLLNCPNGITLVKNELFVVNFSDGLLLKVTEDGQVSELARLPGGGNGHITFARGFLYATSFRGHKIHRISLSGQVTPFAGSGAKGTVDGEAPQAQFSHPNGIAASPQGNRLYINDFLGSIGVFSDDAPTSVLRRIKLASLTDIFLNALNGEGLDAAIAAYHEFKRNTGAFTEVETNALGYRLMTTGQLDAAVEVFKLNVGSYPNSFNVYDSLAESYKNKGEKELAIKNYKKSLELNPNNTNATNMLREIEGE